MTVGDLQDILNRHPRSQEINVNAVQMIGLVLTLEALSEPTELQEAIRLAEERTERQARRRKINKF